jgi:DNA polymerase elongation subunit (family B)
MALVIDIETVGQDPEEIPSRARDYLFRHIEREASNEDEIEVRQKDIVDRFGLDPTTGTIVCIGLYDTKRRTEKALTHKDEKSLLSSFWNLLDESQPKLFVTFNGKSFDFPYINVRSAILEIPPSMQLSVRRFTTFPHFDLREVLAGNERHRRGSLDYFCAIFGIPSPKLHMSGAAVGEAYKQGRVEEIAQYCLADCRATGALYERIKPYYGSSE